VAGGQAVRAAAEAAELFFVAADFGGDGFDAVRTWSIWTVSRGEGAGVAVMLAVFFDGARALG
jgi:hypothetical protein